ncbi:MAG: HDOD domain-containing protein [Desulfosarcinaceae bacterium]|nr:HDOD domain-containing protein [Desulfosarcinaceae bacterium]
MTILTKYHVAAGTRYIGQQQPILLQAFLGTCVGLSLYDPENKVGGILHLLLPEPVSTTAVDQPDKYASTGVPRFIEAVCAAGADKARLKAGVAGGALVGPLNQQDIELDIGGRTAEKVLAILAASGIDIERSETGGFFTCCLGLDLRTGHVSIAPAGVEKIDGDMPIQAPSASEIAAAMERLQPIPQVALKVLRIIDEGEYDIARIGHEVRKDQVISARTLQLANSALFTKKKRVESLDHALVFLGQDLLVKLVISAAVQSYFEQSEMGYSLCKGGIYHHAIGVALVAEQIAVLTEKVAPTRAYTAGLLHDIGKVVLDQYVTAVYPLFYRNLMENNHDIIAVERKLLGTDHIQVGHILAQRWDFPDTLIHCIRHHHHPDPKTPRSELAAIVYLADLLMSRFNSGLEIECHDTRRLTRQMAALGLSENRFPELVDLIPDAALSPAESADAQSGTF